MAHISISTSINWYWISIHAGLKLTILIIIFQRENAGPEISRISHFWRLRVKIVGPLSEIIQVAVFVWKADERTWFYCGRLKILLIVDFRR